MRTRPGSVFLMPTLLVLASPVTHAEPDNSKTSLANYASDKSACIALYDVSTDQYFVYNPEQCNERLSPCSTFKIPNALIGLETGVLTGPDDLKKWDGLLHRRKVNNRDHDLASAVEHSVVWYFQDVARDIGAERMQAWLERLDYGNQDISGGQDRFWLSSSLLITAFEQIRFMMALDAGQLDASRGNQETVTGLMRQTGNLPEGFEGELYGKTGSCIGDETDHGWFTGFYHNDEHRYTFAVNVKGKNEWGWQAREIAVNVLADLD